MLRINDIFVAISDTGRPILAINRCEILRVGKKKKKERKEQEGEKRKKEGERDGWKKERGVGRLLCCQNEKFLLVVEGGRRPGARNNAVK